MSEQETLSFEELAAWSKGRWLADQCEASDNIMLRAIAVAEKKFPTKVVERDEGTGDLVLKDKPVAKPAAVVK